MLLRIRSKEGYIKLGALSNACGAYVTSVLKANDVHSIFEVGLGTSLCLFYRYDGYAIDIFIHVLFYLS